MPEDLQVAVEAPATITVTVATIALKGGVQEVPARRGAGSFYRPGLDILRFIAFLLVFVAHGLLYELNRPTQLGAIARSGEFGMCVFFFLSSYLITELLLRERKKTATVHIRSFYMRRILRIWPLYFAMVGFGFAVGLVVHSHAMSVGRLMSLIFLVGNWYTVTHGYPPGFILPLWSIALEEQFYLVWPSITKYLGAVGILVFSILFMGAAYVTLGLLLHRGESLDPAVWVNSFVQFQYFSLGAITALLLDGRVPRIKKPLLYVLFFAGLLCMRAAQNAVFVENPSAHNDFTRIAPLFFIVLLGCLCLFFSVLQLPAGRLQKPFIYLGKISYGLYVYHLLCLGAVHAVVKHLARSMVLNEHVGEAVTMVIGLAATIAIASLSYRFLESPFLRLKERFTVVRSRPV